VTCPKKNAVREPRFEPALVCVTTDALVRSATPSTKTYCVDQRDPQTSNSKVGRNYMFGGSRNVLKYTFIFINNTYLILDYLPNLNTMHTVAIAMYNIQT